MQMLAATKLENERLGAAAIPRLNKQQLERLIAESLPYQWMQTLAVALKAYSATDANWDAHELAKAIWTVVHEELRNKRQGITSAHSAKHVSHNAGDVGYATWTGGKGTGRPSSGGRPAGRCTVLLMWAARALGKTVPTSSGYRYLAPAPCTGQNLTGGGPDDPHQ